MLFYKYTHSTYSGLWVHNEPFFHCDFCGYCQVAVKCGNCSCDDGWGVGMFNRSSQMESKHPPQVAVLTPEFLRKPAQIATIPHLFKYNPIVASACTRQALGGIGA